MSAAVNSMIGAQSDSIGGVAEGSESGKESSTSESRASEGVRSVFGSIAVEVAAPEAVSSHPSSICAAASALRVGADSCAASRVLFGGFALWTNSFGHLEQIVSYAAVKSDLEVLTSRLTSAET